MQNEQLLNSSLKCRLSDQKRKLNLTITSFENLFIELRNRPLSKENIRVHATICRSFFFSLTSRNNRFENSFDLKAGFYVDSFILRLKTSSGNYYSGIISKETNASTIYIAKNSSL